MVAQNTVRTYMEWIRHFDLLNAFGYIERVVKFNFFSEKTYFTCCVRNICCSTMNSEWPWTLAGGLLMLHRTVVFAEIRIENLREAGNIWKLFTFKIPTPFLVAVPLKKITFFAASLINWRTHSYKIKISSQKREMVGKVVKKIPPPCLNMVYVGLKTIFFHNIFYKLFLSWKFAAWAGHSMKQKMFNYINISKYFVIERLRAQILHREIYTFLWLFWSDKGNIDIFLNRGISKRIESTNIFLWTQTWLCCSYLRFFYPK